MMHRVIYAVNFIICFHIEFIGFVDKKLWLRFGFDGIIYRKLKELVILSFAKVNFFLLLKKKHAKNSNNNL